MDSSRQGDILWTIQEPSFFEFPSLSTFLSSPSPFKSAHVNFSYIHLLVAGLFFIYDLVKPNVIANRSISIIGQWDKQLFLLRKRIFTGSLCRYFFKGDWEGFFYLLSYLVRLFSAFSASTLVRFLSAKDIIGTRPLYIIMILANDADFW